MKIKHGTMLGITALVLAFIFSFHAQAFADTNSNSIFSDDARNTALSLETASEESFTTNHNVSSENINPSSHASPNQNNIDIESFIQRLSKFQEQIHTIALHIQNSFIDAFTS